MLRLLPALALLPACVATDVEESAQSVTNGAAVLALVNDQANTSFTVLDIDCRLRSDAAAKVIKHRDGADKTPGTTDDNRYDDLAELDGVSLVGPKTLEALEACAVARGYDSPPINSYLLTWDDVPAVIDEAAAAAGLDAFAQEACTTAAGTATACIHRCSISVHNVAEDWMSTLMEGWVDTSFASRDAAVDAAAVAFAAAIGAETQCWAQPDCLALEQVIACMESS